MHDPPKHNRLSIAHWFAIILMVGGLPLIGTVLQGKQISTYFEFPPLTRYIEHARFSWWFFGVLNTITLLMVAGIFYSLKGQLTFRTVSTIKLRHKFPWWGWLGLAIMSGGWILAWTRFDWFSVFQKHTYIIAWSGYIILVNALCIKRSGKSLLTDDPRRFSLLLPVSAAFWWFFEYLNRFVQNWYYIGADDFTAAEYTFYGSLSFTTVLAAVLSTYRLLLSFAPLKPAIPKIRPIKNAKLWAVITLLLSCSGLLLLNIYPDILFPLVWAAPVTLLISLQTLAGKKTILSFVGNGDWRPVTISACAALQCGFFWELWNSASLVQWAYCVPYVDRFHIFAMPITGYGGYLPFGLECMAVGLMVVGPRMLLLSDGPG
ncbi:MAG: hypothetical protein GY874_08515 [Desulfobacteraceae bacterium]|nr:hypothetical protein [Desulfobacteraceae bacterium]